MIIVTGNATDRYAAVRLTRAKIGGWLNCIDEGGLGEMSLRYDLAIRVANFIGGWEFSQTIFINFVISQYVFETKGLDWVNELMKKYNKHLKEYGDSENWWKE